MIPVPQFFKGCGVRVAGSLGTPKGSSAAWSWRGALKRQGRPQILSDDNQQNENGSG